MALPSREAAKGCDSPEGEGYHLGGQWLTQRVQHTQGPGNTGTCSVWGLQGAHCAWGQGTLPDLVQEARLPDRYWNAAPNAASLGRVYAGQSPQSSVAWGLPCPVPILTGLHKGPSLRTSAPSSLGSWAGIFLDDATSVVFKRWKWKRKKKAANRHNFPPEAILARKQLESLLIILKCF